MAGAWLVPDEQRGEAVDIQRSLGMERGLNSIDLRALASAASSNGHEPWTRRASTNGNATRRGPRTNGDAPRTRGARTDVVGTQGTVKWFNAKKGYGFIAADGGGEDLFVHHSGITGSGFRSLEDGQRVRFTVAPGRKGPQATEVCAA